MGEVQSAEMGNSADYAAYLARQGNQMIYPQVIVEDEGGSVMVRGLLAVKERARLAITRSIPEPQASLLQWASCWATIAGCPETWLMPAFRRTGMTTSHYRHIGVQYRPAYCSR
ncbi:MAG: hypothetical protein R3C44_07340 [Chloroflexota bacterium]